MWTDGVCVCRSIDEFVYQYTAFALWRSKTQGKTDEEKAILAESGQVRLPFSTAFWLAAS